MESGQNGKLSKWKVFRIGKWSKWKEVKMKSVQNEMWSKLNGVKIKSGDKC